ncbi:MAG: penicillin-binding protein 1B [Gammaproteobacteria bacterium]|nr:penicillin-binding protein 1B [Gammaproteobacteria bacterium]
MTESKSMRSSRSKKSNKKKAGKLKQPAAKALAVRSKKQPLTKQSFIVSCFGYLTSPYSFIVMTVFLLASLIYVVTLDFQVRERFEGRIWAVPSKVYARSLELKPNMPLDPDSFEQELRLMAYQEVRHFPNQPGQYRRWQGHFELISRAFKDAEKVTEKNAIRLAFEHQRLLTLEHLYKPEKIESVRLDPALIGNIYPGQIEDRQLLKLTEVPERLIKTLVAVEDRSFYEHWGVNPLAILRALMVNIQAGEKKQGGSTLTQQLVKNLFLSSKRSYWRKLNEAVMALLLEFHYDKNTILEAYINEVYLGQNKNASVHGFELGSQFYFNKPLNKLSTEKIALLIGLIKGPSYYNPRKNQDSALARRNVVLEVMREQNVISDLHYKKNVKRPLGVVSRMVNSGVRYPAFIDLIKRQLSSRFSADVLKHEGLKIFSTLDPQIQMAAEQAAENTLNKIQQYLSHVPLQTAIIVSDVSSAEVLALVGDKDPSFHGFNRALDASRQIGSLIKPAIYLAALNIKNQSSQGFHLSSVLSDSPLSLQSRNGDVWQPQNYDHNYRGDVLFYDALVHSYNVPSVRLGLTIGLEEIVLTLRNLGLEKEVPVYPSMLLGAFELSAYDVATMYQTIAADGHQLSLHAIRTVLSHNDIPLVHFADEKKYTIEEDNMYLLQTALHDVTRFGTAKALSSLPFNVAGKTGTTDRLRDSWFAGFSEDKLAVVWVGNDDNLETGLTGASGALQVWSDLFQHMPVQSLDLTASEQIDHFWVDKKTGLRAGFGCQNTVKLPFLKNRHPVEYANCD